MKFNELKNLIEQQQTNESWKDIAMAGMLGITALSPQNMEAKILKKKPSQETIYRQNKINKMLDDLIPALIAVESGGRNQAVGDKGKAKGPLQIWKIYIDDVNNFYGTNYSHSDAFDRIKAIEIVRKYLLYWGTYYEKTTGKPITLKILAQIHNGGPFGYTKPQTEAYWNKVHTKLKTLANPAKEIANY